VRVCACKVAPFRTHFWQATEYRIHTIDYSTNLLKTAWNTEV